MIKATVHNKVSFHYVENTFFFPGRNNLKAFITRLFKKEGQRLAEINYIFCDDEYLLQINRDFLQHDYYTDIISFDLSPDKNTSMGEIYISIERVRDNAKQFNTSFKHELHRVIFHGALHLCGYKDKKDKEVIEMRKMENKYLALYFKA